MSVGDLPDLRSNKNLVFAAGAAALLLTRKKRNQS
jgi:hypothetical protein